MLGLLAACSGSEPGATDDARQVSLGAQDPLPRPQPGTTSVTGMPDPAMEGRAPIIGEAVIGMGTALEDGVPRAPALASDGMPLLEDNPETGLLAPAAAGPTSTTAAGSGVADAVAQVTRYYTAIDRGDLTPAYALWGDGGAASGRTPEQFATGFADISAITVTPGEATLASTGDRVDVPVTVTSTRRDGRTQTSVGLYVLRATADSREWRIADASLRPLQR